MQHITTGISVMRHFQAVLLFLINSPKVACTKFACMQHRKTDVLIRPVRGWIFQLLN